MGPIEGPGPHGSRRDRDDHVSTKLSSSLRGRRMRHGCGSKPGSGRRLRPSALPLALSLVVAGCGGSGGQAVDPAVTACCSSVDPTTGQATWQSSGDNSEQGKRSMFRVSASCRGWQRQMSDGAYTGIAHHRALRGHGGAQRAREPHCGSPPAAASEGAGMANLSQATRWQTGYNPDYSRYAPAIEPATRVPEHRQSHGAVGGGR